MNLPRWQNSEEVCVQRWPKLHTHAHVSVWQRLFVASKHSMQPTSAALSLAGSQRSLYRRDWPATQPGTSVKKLHSNTSIHWLLCGKYRKCVSRHLVTSKSHIYMLLVSNPICRFMPSILMLNPVVLLWRSIHTDGLMKRTGSLVNYLTLYVQDWFSSDHFFSWIHLFYPHFHVILFIHSAVMETLIL